MIQTLQEKSLVATKFFIAIYIYIYNHRLHTHTWVLIISNLHIMSPTCLSPKTHAASHLKIPSNNLTQLIKVLVLPYYLRKLPESMTTASFAFRRRLNKLKKALYFFDLTPERRIKSHIQCQTQPSTLLSINQLRN